MTAPELVRPRSDESGDRPRLSTLGERSWTLEEKTYRTPGGRTLTDADLDAIGDEVEHKDYDVEELKSRRRGRPLMGSAPADVVPVRLEPELKRAVDERAEAEHLSTSEVIRRALRKHLHVA